MIGSDAHDRLVKTITVHMQTVPPPIRERAIEIFAKVDSAFGERMAENLGVKQRELTVATRKP